MHYQVTIVKLCGKKTPLVHHRRRRRRKTLHHENSPEFDPNKAANKDNVHVHPVALKSDIALPRNKYKEFKESRKQERKEWKVKESAGKPQPKPREERSVADSQKYEAAQALANKLGAKLLAVLPPEVDKQSKYEKVENETTSGEEATARERRPRRESAGRERQGRQRDQKSASPEKIRSGRTEQANLKRRSKSETTAPPRNSLDIPESTKSKQFDDKTERRKNINSDKSPNLKEVTIAKLGPFKMSLEVKSQDQVPENKGKERTRKKSTKTSEEIKLSPGSETEIREQRKRSKSKAGRKEETEVKARNEEPVRKEDVTKSTAETVKYEHQISTEARKGRRKKEKIVVSRLARSDRPLRERSPAAQEAEERRPGWSRSVSQPGPAPDPALLSATTDTPGQPRLKRNLSSTLEEKSSCGNVNLPKLKRSSTAKDCLDKNSKSNKVSAEISESLERKSSKKAGTLSLYDNLGYDKSPDLRHKECSGQDKRQQTLQMLKDQIQVGLLGVSGSPAQPGPSLTSTARRKMVSLSEGGAGQYEVMGGEGDSDCSGETDRSRQSPPTQLQSLSEGSSGCSVRKAGQAGGGSPELEDSSDSELGTAAIFSSLGLVHASGSPGSAAQLLRSDSESGSEAAVPVFAANPHVRLPCPVAAPRPSVAALHNTQPSDTGCDSDSTLDIRDSGPSGPGRGRPAPQHRQRRGRNWALSEQEDSEQWEAGSDWEVREDSEEENTEANLDDNITDVDSVSIATDGIAQQMMY